MISRRDALLSTLFGTGYVGLRALATGLPAALLLNPRKALADLPPDACSAKDKAQYVVFATSSSGDPISNNVPGTYDDPKIVHSADPLMASAPLIMRGKSYAAAAAWSRLPQAVRDRTVFWHLMTNTPVHPNEPTVLSLMNAVSHAEMLPSALAKRLAPCLGTIQSQPISVSNGGPSEGLRFNGAALPMLPALSLKATLLNPAGPLTKLQAMRDQSLNSIYDVYKNGASAAQRNYIDSFVTSQNQVRNIDQTLLDSLSSIADNGPDAQMTAAVALILMNVTPVVAVHIPFGGDNHNDTGLSREASETDSGIATIASLMSKLATAGYADRVTFMSLNVFGRTMLSNGNGRSHNPNHQVSITIGKPFLGGVVGGVGPVGNDYGALPISSQTGKGGPGGDITPVSSLASFGKTMMSAFGVDAASITADIPSGTVISAALA